MRGLTLDGGEQESVKAAFVEPGAGDLAAVVYGDGIKQLPA